MTEADGGTHSSRTWLEVDLSAVVHNYRRAVELASGSAVWPVVKADGYGLGAVEISSRLAAEGADGFCVATVEEGIALRQGGVTQPVVVMAGFFPGQERLLARWNLHTFLFRLSDAKRLTSALAEDDRVGVFVKVDTGMARLGCVFEEGVAILEALENSNRVTVMGITSHLACADALDNPETRRQVDRFRRFLQHPVVKGHRLRNSLANSAGVMGWPESHFDWVRPGIMLYGGSPFFPDLLAAEAGLKPVVTWRSRVVQIQPMPPLMPLGYGHAFTPKRPSRIAWLGVGYGDGYSRRLGNRARVVADGARLPVVGRVCMDLTAVDVTDHPEVRVGSTACLLGSERMASVDIEELALLLDTIPYEIICDIGGRVERHYVG
ncbi:MAG: alanine racemase [Magnetococcales bacterium]|nr:alanine racemase [Magnetococcales bacterium]